MTIIPSTIFIFAAFDVAALIGYTVGGFFALFAAFVVLAFVMTNIVIPLEERRSKEEQKANEAKYADKFEEARRARVKREAEANSRAGVKTAAEYAQEQAAFTYKMAELKRLAGYAWEVTKAYEEHRIWRAHVARAARRFAHQTWATFLAERDLDLSPPPLAEGFRAFYADALRASDLNNAPADLRDNALYHAWNDPTLAEAKALLPTLEKPRLGAFPPPPTEKMVLAVSVNSEKFPIRELAALRDGFGLRLRLISEARNDEERAVLCRPPHPEAVLNRYIRLEFDRFAGLRFPSIYGGPPPVPEQLQALALQYPRPPTADLDRVRYLENTDADARLLLQQLRQFAAGVESRDWVARKIPLYIEN